MDMTKGHNHMLKDFLNVALSASWSLDFNEKELVCPEDDVKVRCPWLTAPHKMFADLNGAGIKAVNMNDITTKERELSFNLLLDLGFCFWFHVEQPRLLYQSIFFEH